MPKQRVWQGALAVDSRGGAAAFGAWLRSPSGLLLWQAAERVGNITFNLAEQRALLSLVRVARRHRAGSLQVTVPVQVSTVRKNLALLQGIDAEALAMAQAVLPKPPTFESSGLTQVGPHQYVAHGTHDYQVWTDKKVCSCPAFVYNVTRPCKHLKAAIALES